MSAHWGAVVGGVARVGAVWGQVGLGYGAPHGVDAGHAGRFADRPLWDSDELGTARSVLFLTLHWLWGGGRVRMLG